MSAHKFNVVGKLSKELIMRKPVIAEHWKM